MKLLIGGSPCTHWSIAQTKNRETEPEGLGWELFKNYLIALEKFKPDYFLYENNKSMSAAIREQITRELGVEPILINSALVSAQSRQRLYWTNIPGVEQPEDRGIMLRDILETGLPMREKAYCLKAQYTNSGPANAFRTSHFNATMVAEPVRIGSIENTAENTSGESRPYRVYSADGKSVTLSSTDGGAGAATGLYATPLRVGDMPNASGEVSGSQSGRIYSVDGKGVPLQARPNGGGADGAVAGLYAVPFDCDVIITENSIRCQRRDKKHSTVQGSHVNFEDGKSQTLSVAHTPKVIEPIEYNPLQSCDVVVTDQNIRCAYKDGSGTAQGYTVYFDDVKGPSVIAGHAHKMKIIEPATRKEWPVYEVRDGQITIKGKQYPIKLADGFYIIRKLTVTECKRLQTVPEEYIFPVSDTQAYKMLGNGWTVDVIAHILHYAPGITEEPLEVLSMYDGMSCGHLALDKLGAHIAHYYATEIDKYAVQTTQHNFPDTIQLGDAFQVRDDGWSLPGLDMEETVATPVAEAVEEQRQVKQATQGKETKRKAAQLKIAPITLREANSYVARHHRHNMPTNGHKWSVACYDGDRLCGVAIAGQPIARKLDDGLTIEIRRVCTDGTYNACSILYGACARIARDMGYKRVITYTLISEPGTSLKASGFENCGEAGGVSWNMPSRPREVEQITLFGTERKYPDEKKIRWERRYK